MTRSELIQELKKYFSIQELVCRHVYNAFGEKAWQFFDLQLLETILVLREDILKDSMTVNNWKNGGTYTQRGLRCNICQIAKDKTVAGELYMSAHCNGAAIDFDLKNHTAEQTRDIIKMNSYKLPYRIRLEKGVNWVHIDIYDDVNSNFTVTEF